ncbi:hypothetical protein E1A91_D11G371900v1 [Gossypium mustelinum]|uniref:AAA+ ATPase domain-containing protein n=1 Tax=Gossypium mustelinum TaxID=34275 RepID=A0A5D2T1I0_GOSMU|nr:hypothetical protein E1A91_D11G371900v1 [Gossypium mustelinum]
MEIITGAAGNLVTGVVGYVFQKIRRNFSYKRMVSDFEKKVEMLKDKRDRVLLDVDAARKNDENIYPEVNSWLAKADKMIDLELKEVKGLEDEAKNKCFIGLCPNFKARYQLSKKAEEDAGAVDELLQQGGFDKVSCRDVPQPVVVVPPKDFDDFDSRKLVFNKIMEAVKDPNLNIIGVYGMPGVGKTTLVKEVIRQVKEDKLFDSVVMAVVTHTPDIKKIQDQIADTLGLTFKEQSTSGRASRLCQRLKKEKKIFVVLDDIWAKLDLMEVGIPFGDEHQGCTMLLASRDLNVLSKDMDAKMRYSIGVLEHEEAWEFFKKIAGDGVESSDLLPIATEVAKKCGGLPIAIRTLATSLRNEPPFVWEDALRQLNRPSSSNFIEVSAAAYSSIEWSYDRLQSEEHKQIFLLCSLLGHNIFFEELLVCAMGLGLFRGVNTVEETRNRLLTVVSRLKASCLLLDGYNNLHVDMHDLICDVAMSIAANNVFVLRDEDVLNEWPDDETMKECDKIVLDCPSINKLPDQLKCPKLTFFGMVSKDPLMEIPENFFKEMKNLQVLILSDMNLSSLPSSISLLPNLRTLCLVDCALGDIALIGELKNLEILTFDGSDIEMLPEEIGQLAKLKLLDIANCSKLKRIPPGVFCKLSRLEELYVDDCFVGWGAEGNFSQESNCSVAELNALSCLTTLEIHFPNAKIIPKGFSFEKLRRYIIFIGEVSDWDWDWGWVRECSRTLKLSLQTSISFLNNGVKVLLKKAENLYIDEVKGVEILQHESEVRDYFQQLKNLHIQNGAMIQYILKDNGDDHKIELQLETLTLQDLPKLISFFSENEGSASISPQGTTLFNQKTLFPKLKDLVLCSISIERIWLPQAFCSTPNLTKLIIKGCTNLKYVLSDSMVEYLQQLEYLEISECKCIQEIISKENIIKEAFRNRYLICFPRLNTLKLKGLQKLIGFCHEDYNVEFPTLKILEIERCPKLKGFIHNSKSKEIPIDAVFFNNKAAFPNLQKLTITHLRDAKRIWHSKLHTNSFFMLKELTVKECDVLLNIFPPFLLGAFQRLEKLIVIDCASLEEVFQFQVQGLDTEETDVVASQLREVNLDRLPRLKHVWTKYHKGNISFEILRKVRIQDCWSLKTLFPFSIAEGLQQLERLVIQNCGLEEIVSKNDEGSDKQEIWFAFNQLSFLMLWHLPYLTCFYPGIHRTTWSALKKLKMAGCWRIKIFGHEESQIQNSLFLIEKVIPQLEEVSFTGNCIKMISDGQYESDLFCNIKFLRISYYSDVSVVFLISFLRRFYNLESLALGSCSFKELASFENDACEDQDMIITIPKVKKLRLDLVKNIRHLWKQDSPLGHICASLECLEVWNCGNLINLGLDLSFSGNLTTLDVFKCHEMLELITSSKARSLACLVTMRIRECERMREVVESDGDETSYEIVFRGLKRLELHCLQSLTSFCLRNCALRFPSLEQVTLSQCPRMKNFNQGGLTTPKLQKVQLTETDFTGRWAGDLNATVEQLYQEQVGYRGLKHLKLSEFPKLVDIWSRNPQEMLDFTTLEFLEVCDSNNLRYIFNLSMAFGLGQLRQMEIKRCCNLEQVIKEEGPITIVEEAITDSSKILSVFPRLRSIIVESCPDMISFYMGSKGLECPSLVEIKVANCSNMTTFVSTFSGDEDKKEIIGVKVDKVATFFCDKVVFPKLEKLTISHLRNVKRMWYKQLCSKSFSNLKELEVKHCDSLLNIFPHFFLGVFQSLEKLRVADCASLEEVFQLQIQMLDIEEACIVTSKLRQVELFRLPKLTHVWNKDPNENISFENLREVHVQECWSLKTLFPFSMAKDLQQLESLIVDSCGVEEIVSKSVEELNQLEMLFEFNQLSFLALWTLPNLVCFYPGMHNITCPMLKRLKTYWPTKTKMFGNVVLQLLLIGKIIPQLEHISLTADDIAMITDGQFAIDLFSHIKVLQITEYIKDSEVVPFHFFQRFSNLQKLKMVGCNFKEFSPYEGDVVEERNVTMLLPRINKLTLQGVHKMTHLWKQGSPFHHICANLETLKVSQCVSLISLSCASSSFQNLTTLVVWYCEEMVELITSSKSQCLEQLVTLKIGECEMMREVIASDGDEATHHEIIFKELKYLELYDLQNLKSFCSGNYTLKFPSLDEVHVSICPAMENFCNGALSTPKLQEVETERGVRRCWDLNATIEQLSKEECELFEKTDEDSL